jgi:hypothetical protein
VQTYQNPSATDEAKEKEQHYEHQSDFKQTHPHNNEFRSNARTPNFVAEKQRRS